METALTVLKPDVEAYEPRDITEALRVADVMVKSRLLGSKVATPEQAFVIMATGKELGLTAMQSLRSIHVIEGKPCCSADLLLALCKRESRICKYFRLVKSDEKIATYETHREGESRPTTLSFTIAEAQQAKLTGKDNWQKYPAAMLRARCIAALARAVYPDLVLGIYETDEMESRNGSTRKIRTEPVDFAANEGAAATVANGSAHGPTPPVGDNAEGSPPANPASPASEVPRVPMPTAAESLRKQIDEAKSADALLALGQAIGAAHKARHITDAERKELIVPYTSRMKALQPEPTIPAEPTQATAAA